MRRVVFLCAVTAVLAASGAGATSSPERILRRWSTEDGLPNQAATSLLQTRDGNMLLSGWAGMFRFDGARFVPVAMDLPNIHALVVTEARDGALWIGSNTNGVARWTPQGFSTFTEADGLSSNYIQALVEDDEGRLWVGTDRGLDVIVGGRVSAVLHERPVAALSRGRAGVWASAGDTVCQSRSDRMECTAPGDMARRPRLLLEDRRGTLWVADEGRGLVAIDAAGGRVAIGTSGPGALAPSAITALADSDDGVWVGHADGAVDEVVGRAATRVRAGPGSAVVALLEDRAGTLWALSGELLQFRRSRVRMVRMEGADCLSTSVVQDRDGRIWAGTECGPVGEFDGTTLRPRFKDLVGAGGVQSLLAASDGSLWVGTVRAGLLRIAADGTARRFTLRDGLLSVHVRVLFEARDGAIWIGTDEGGLHRFAGGRLSPIIERADHGSLGLISSIAEDADGRIWVASNDFGLSVYQGGELGAAPPPREGPRLPSSNISALVFDTRGDLWIGTAARGLFRLRHGRFEAFGPAQGLPDRLVGLIVEDRDENIWVGTAHGIVRLDRANIEDVAEGRGSLHPIVLDRLDGLLNPETSGGGFDPSGLRARDGSLWFSTLDGIAVVSDATFQIDHVPLAVSIDEARVDGAPVGVVPGGRLDVPAGATSLEIGYTAPTLVEPERVRFEYRLVGLDDHWIEAGSRRTAYFSRPRPGTYRFETRAANHDWTWSEQPAALEVVFLPLWWERRSVQAAGMALLLVVTAGVVFRVASWRHRARMAALEREHAVQQERERIARDLHDDLGSRLAHISLLSDRVEGSGDAPIGAAAREAAQVVDELVWVVDARNDTVEAFANYVAHIAEEFVRGAGLNFRVVVAPALGHHLLPAAARRNLYMAVKEAITNALKHSKGSEVALRMDLSGGQFRVTVADNGVGLPAGGGDPTGMGLSNMKDRLEGSGGSAAFDTVAGGGMRVTLTVPVARAAGA